MQVNLTLLQERTSTRHTCIYVEKLKLLVNWIFWIDCIYYERQTATYYYLLTMGNMIIKASKLRIN